jgi:toxin ParE1/3/4
MSSYSLSDVAVQDLNDICDYIAQKNPRAASQLFDTIRQKCRLLAEFPGMGKSYEQIAPNLRGIIVQDYIILYYPREDGVDVARIFSGYRDIESIFMVE